MAKIPPKTSPGASHGSFGAASADEDERTTVAGPPGTDDSASLTGGPDREYRSGEIEPSSIMQPQSLPSSDWEEKTVVDDSQLYSASEGPGGPSIGTAAGDEELTVDEPQRALAAMSRGPAAAQRPAPAPAPPVIEPIQAKLVVLAGSDSGREFALRGSSVTVGRGMDNDVVLTDISVSRKHLSITFDGSRYHLTDKGSGNGTLINQRVETATCTLRDGDRIEIGNTVFRFEHPASKDDPRTGPSAPVGTVPGTGSPASAGQPAPPAAASRPQQGMPEVPQPELPPLPGPAASAPGPGLGAPPAQAPGGPSGGAPWESPSPGEQALAAPAPSAPAPAHTTASASPAVRPLVASRPLERGTMLIAVAATLVGLIAISVAGMFLSDDDAMAAQHLEQDIHVEDLLAPLGAWAVAMVTPDAPALPQGIDADASAREESGAGGEEPAAKGEEPAAKGEEPASAEQAAEAGDEEAASAGQTAEAGEEAGSEP